MNKDVTTIILGDEHDDALLKALHFVLKKNGATSTDKSWIIGGSQEIETIIVKLGDNMITIESETFIGISITGLSNIVEDLKKQVRSQLRV